MSELPKGWQTCTLQELTKAIAYGFTASAVPQAVGPRMLRITDIQNQGVNWETVPYCVAGEITKFLLEAGDIVVARTGATTGKSYLINFVPEPTVFASYLIRVRPNKALLPEYLARFMESPDYWRQITMMSTGTAQPGVNASVLSGLEIPIAPLPEQRSIVAKIEALMARSRKAREALEFIPSLLEHYRQGTLAAAFRGDLTGDWRKTAQQKWSIERAADVCAKVQSGGTPKDGFQDEPGVPFLKVYNIVNQQVRFEERPQFVAIAAHAGPLAKSVTLPGDVLMNIVGPPLGKVAVVPDQFPEWNINQAITLFRPSSRISTGWLYWTLCGGQNISEIIHETKGSAGQVNISLSQCRDFVFPVPPVDEQLEIVRRLEGLFAHTDAVEAGLRELVGQLDSLDQSILAKAFRGELVPQDPTDESAEILLSRIRGQKPTEKPALRRGRPCKGI